MLPIEFITIGVLLIFSFTLCIYTIYFIKKKGKYLRYNNKQPPTLKYLKIRLRVASVFNDKFDEIKVLAKCLKQPTVVFDYTKSSLNQKDAPNEMELTPMNKNISIEVSENSELLQQHLRQKVTSLYETIFLNAEDGSLVHKATRFEIKSRCILHPHDIFGSQISKTIEDVYQEIIDDKEKSATPPFCSRIFQRIQKYFSQATTILADKLQIKRRNLPWLIFLIIGVIIFIGLAFNVIPTLELSIYCFLMVFTALRVLVIKRKYFYSQFAWWSLIYSCWSTTKGTLYVYIYDFFRTFKLQHYIYKYAIASLNLMDMTKNIT